MKNKAKVLALAVFVASSFAHQATANEWRTNHRIHRDDYNNTYGGRGYLSGGCDFGCKAFAGIIGVMLAERGKRLRLQRQRYRSNGFSFR